MAADDGKNGGMPAAASISAGGTMSPVTKCSSLWHMPATFHCTSTSPAFAAARW
jgi:hypothetical protein